KLHFDAALTLTHHATNLILPGGANITTAAGDEAEFIEYASGDWRCLNYSKTRGAPNLTKGSDVASASALALGSTGNYFDVTGTTTITSINSVGIGTIIKLHFDAALTLTHHATNLILPGGANITTAAGDEAEFIEYASGDWRCTNYSKASGEAAGSGESSLITNGYQVFASGLILQWGQVVPASRSTELDLGTVSFPITFPNATLGVQAIVDTNDTPGLSDNSMFINTVSTSGFNPYSGGWVVASRTYGFYWFAYGY
ncbi:hypothetical protein KAR91_58425, partial [Candidatus Pacearchaeota archaeon]|nr:hypothetical protein [Candidatus Pacearchaeota archaeon]